MQPRSTLHMLTGLYHVYLHHLVTANQNLFLDKVWSLHPEIYFDATRNHLTFDLPVDGVGESSPRRWF